MTEKQPEALRMANALNELDAKFSFPGLCGEAAAEPRAALVATGKESLQVQQEPVAWMYEWDGRKHLTFTDQRFVEKAHPHFNKSTQLYTAPPRREWQGLTDEEVMNCYLFGVVDLQDIIGFYKRIETKLREKNAA